MVPSPALSWPPVLPARFGLMGRASHPPLLTEHPAGGGPSSCLAFPVSARAPTQPEPLPLGPAQRVPGPGTQRLSIPASLALRWELTDQTSVEGALFPFLPEGERFPEGH